MADDSTHITLPDVNVTPDEQPPKADLTGIMLPGGALTQPTLLDGMTNARLSGYDWPEIDGHMADARDTAARAGYTDQEVDQHLGMPTPMPGELHTDPEIPTSGLARPMAPGEYINNPNGSWSNEITTTGMVNGKPSVVPTVWLLNGQPHQVDEDRAVDLAQKSGLNFQSFPTMSEADAFAQKREDNWQNIEPGDKSVPSLWTGKVNFPYPTDKEAVDYGIGVAQSAGLHSAEASTNARDNVRDMSETLGVPAGTVYQMAHQDPMLQDALTQPQPPAGEKPPIFGDPEAALAAQTSTAMEPFTAGLSKALGESALQIVGGIAGALKPEEYLKSEERFLNQQMSPQEAAGFIGQHVLGGLAAGKTVPKGETIAENPGLLSAAKATLADTAGSLGDARAVKPSTPDTGLGSIPTSAVEDELYRLQTNATADKVQLLKLGQSLPKEWRNTKFQEQASAEVESRQTGTPEVSPEVQQFLDTVKPLTDKQESLAKSIKAKLLVNPEVAEKIVAADPSLGIRSVDQGYMHRVVDIGENPLGKLDPNVERDVITGGTPRSLSTFASGLQRRAQDLYVLENDKTGQRMWGGMSLDEAGIKMGGKVPGMGDDTWTVKPATMAEVEANTDIKYQKNFLANTMENVARLGRVDRNLNFLQTMAKELEKNAQFIPKDKWEGAFNGPPGMKRVELPQMDGWAQPQIADVLNDFFNRDKGDLDGFLTKANRFLIGSLFITPVPHALNVAAHWTVSRGWEWIKPWKYGQAAKDSLDAVREVWNLGPRYMQHLREGSGLMYASTQTNNFYRTVMDKVFNEQLADDSWHPLAKALGFQTVSDMVKAEYRWSNRALWAVNDMFMLQRQFELQRQGLPIRDAIFQAEKDIPNYRVSSQVMGSHVMSEVLKSPNFVNFGRYKYGQIRAIYMTVHDMVAPGLTGQERFDALGKALVLATIGIGVIPNIPIVRAMGPFSLVNAAYQLTTGQKDWTAALSSLVTLAPVLNLAASITRGSDIFGRSLVAKGSGPQGKVAEGLEAAVGQFYPGQLLLNALKPGGVAKSLGSLVGLNLGQPYVPSAAAQRAVQSEAAGRERKDAFIQWFESVTGGQQAAPPPGRTFTHGPSNALPRPRTKR